MNKLILYVDTDDHKAIVTSIFRAAKFPLNVYELVVIDGKPKLIDIAEHFPLQDGTVIGRLVNLEISNIPDAKEYAIKKFAKTDLEIFFGVPEVEAWIFADDELARKHAKHKHAKKILERLPLPEEVLHPKQTAYNIFRTSDWEFLSGMDLTKATARSSSLRDFLSRVSEILKIKLNEISNPISRSLDRRLFVNLLKEINNADTIIFKSCSGNIYTAADMIKNIINQNDIGIEYTNSILRISRDFLSRKAKKKE